LTLNELHQQYGERMIALEILQNQIRELKKKISDEMNRISAEKKDG